MNYSLNKDVWLWSQNTTWNYFSDDVIKTYEHFSPFNQFPMDKSSHIQFKFYLEICHISLLNGLRTFQVDFKNQYISKIKPESHLSS